MSEALTSAIKKADLRKHIDEIQQEVTKLRNEMGGQKKGEDASLITERLQQVIRNESSKLAKEIGLGGDYPLRFMLTNAIVCLAWSAFSVKKTTLDQSLPFEETLEMVDLSSGLGQVLETVVAEATAYGELSKR